MLEAGYEFTVCDPEVDESDFETVGIAAVEFAEKLALAKAKSIASKFPNSLVIGADTIVDCDGLIIGKPADAKDALRITKMLFSQSHKVITGLAIIRLADGIGTVTSDSTTVYPKKLSDAQIDEHIKSQAWQGKAGAYAIQENGDEFIERIQGSFTNVMGLPMELLQDLLNKFIK